MHCWCEPISDAVAAHTAPGAPANAAAAAVGVSTPAGEQQGGVAERGRAREGEARDGADDGVGGRQWQHTVQGGVELGVWMFLLYAAQAVGLQSASADDASVILALSVG